MGPLTIEFSQDVTIENFVENVQITLADSDGSNQVVAILESIGSGNINAKVGDSVQYLIHGDGSNITYSMTDQTGGHGKRVWSIEWLG